MKRGFLRPRGDAPLPWSFFLSLLEVPPPTRRCTAIGDNDVGGVDGSSAHAEMHPSAGARARVARGFLRPRGDAPVAAAEWVRATRVPPPTRRCTGAASSRRRSAWGSSAHAEMHPSRKGSLDGSQRFLRPRGDAPMPGTTKIDACGVPPPTRRCTRARRLDALRSAGSSAHAEMHRARARDATRGSGFLRPRGDAPLVTTRRRRARSVPPPTRRCTRAEQDACSVSQGSSAHAEMHPSLDALEERGQRFLRPRGDAPRRSASRPRVARVPPPTRRCTREWESGRRRTLGSSAHAEMHRASRRAISSASGFLRPRGDAPRQRLGLCTVKQVPPPTRRCTLKRQLVEPRGVGSSAHAEMHPVYSWTAQRDGRFLRPRGDAPYPSATSPDVTAVPPPTRRCTRVVRDLPQRALGSSAHAEMHPSQSRRTASLRWFLRPRGDAPARSEVSGARDRVPPPTLRCTDAPGHDGEVEGGSSAHAEMHPSRPPQRPFLRPRGDAPAVLWCVFRGIVITQIAAA